MTTTMEEVAGWLREAAEIFEISYQNGPGHEIWKRNQKLFADRAAQVESMGWRPIEEAPMTGEEIIGWNGHCRQITSWGIEFKRWEFSAGKQTGSWYPTHFTTTATGEEMTLPNDIARCAGVGSYKEGWREGCERCLRRTSPEACPNHSWLVPPEIIAFECEYLIEAKP